MSPALWLPPVASLLGSIPPAYLLVRRLGRGDVRAIGSGNVGATNALRAAGWRAALVVHRLQPAAIGDQVLHSLTDYKRPGILKPCIQQYREQILAPGTFPCSA